MSDLMRLAGINSGYDTEAMIEKMLSSYQTKIDNQNKKLQKLTWQQEAYRDITSKLTSFKNKYFDILKRDSYLMSPNSFNKFKTSIANKTNSDKISGISVTTSSSSIAGNHTLKVKQTATATKLEGRSMTPAGFELDAARAAENSEYTVEGGNRKYSFALDVKVGDNTKTIEFDVSVAEANGKINSNDFESAFQTAINEKLEEAFGVTGKTSNTTGGLNAAGEELFLSVAKGADGKMQLKVGGNATVTVTEKTGDFGLVKPTEKLSIAAQSCVTGTNAVAVTVNGVTKNVAFEGVSETYFDSRDVKGNEAILKEYNSLKTSAYIKDKGKIPTEEELENYSYSSVQAAKDKNSAALSAALNKEFSGEKVKFSIDDKGYLTASKDGKAVEFGITSTAGGTLGIAKASTSNVFKGGTTLKDMGIAGKDEDVSFKINGKEIKVKSSASIDQLIDAVAKSGAGVTMTYSKLENKFIVTANDMGNGGDVKIEANKFTAALGLAADKNTALSAEIGQNAIFELDGVEIYHNSNSYEIDGSTIKFGDAEIGSEYEFGISRSYDDIKQTIKDFVNDYNQLLDDIHKYTDTAPKRDKKNNLYEPLTDAEKEDMSEDEIKKWEDAAKQGILYNDSTVSGILSKLRFKLYNSVTLDDGTSFGLYSMGIKTMSYREDGTDDAALGKLKIDEDAFDKAFEENPDAIIKLFTDSETGIMKQVNTVLDDAVRTTGTTKGTLIRKAGLEKGTTAKDNAIYRQMEQINKRIQTLQDRYESKENYWWSVFTNLEKMMSNMNSQMSYMSSYLGSSGTTSSY